MDVLSVGEGKHGRGSTDEGERARGGARGYVCCLAVVMVHG